MRKLYRKFIPKLLRHKLSPVLRKLYFLLCVITGKQYPDIGIGVVSGVPKKSLPYRKISFSQQGEDLILDRILLKICKKPLTERGVYVDIGAFHPVNHSVTYLLYLRGWNGVAVDASNKTKESYTKIRPKDVFYNCVVGKEDNNKVKFYLHDDQNDDSSLINTKYPKNNHNYNVVEREQKTINTIIKECNLQSIDVLNVDVEGAELEIMRSLDFNMIKPKIICIEIHEVDIHSALKTDVAKILMSEGYRCVGVSVITYFFVHLQTK